MKIAEIGASKGHLLPANLLWMELLLAGKDKDALTLWKNWLQSAQTVAFRRLLQESHLRKEPQLIEKLINLLKEKTPLTKGSLGNAYSRLINYYLTEGNVQKAEAHYKDAIKSGLDSQDMNRSTLARLKTAAQEAGHELNL